MRLSKADKAAAEFLPGALRSRFSASPLRRQTESPQVPDAERDAQNHMAFHPSPNSQLVSPQVLPTSPQRTLKRPVSLSSIPDHMIHQTGQASSPPTDDSFYPSYLHRSRREPRERLFNLLRTGDPDLKPAIPASGAHTRPLAPELPFYNSANNAALWDGRGWDSIQQKSEPDATPPLPGLSPPRGSLMGEWNLINLGGG
jgi:hypothetical protein